MNLAVFGGFAKAPFRDGWTRETAVAVLGGGELDLTRSTPGPGAVLRTIAILGGVEVIVPEGSRVALSGFSLFGGRDVKVEPGGGPELQVRAYAVFGGVEVKSTGR